MPPAVEAWSSNHWTTTDVPWACTLYISFSFNFYYTLPQAPVHNGLGAETTQTNPVFCAGNLEKQFLKYLAQGLGHSGCSRNHHQDNGRPDSDQTHIS